jgi:Holliday junction DNA helicase RuvB
MREEVLAGEAVAGEEAVDVGLRPTRLDEFVGQLEVKDHLSIVLEAARKRRQAADHVLLAGPPGLGKTTLAMIIAAEMSSPLRLTSGPAITHAGDLAAILSGLNEGDVLFVDEIHRLPRAVEEVLYPAMEDFQLDIVVGQGPSARTIRRAVAGEDVKRLTAVPGIGQKGAQRIILELKDRIGAPTGGSSGAGRAPAPAQDAWRGQVHAGLVGLGWSAKEADKAVEAVADQEPVDAGAQDVAGLLRAALRTLSKA